MTDSRSKLAILICILVVLTVLGAISVASLVLWLVGNWEKHEGALTLTLKIMWGSWFVLLTATVLTWVTIFGWKFRRAWPGKGPMALLKSIAAGEKPPSLAKTGGTSFTFTVVLVSLFGTTVLASVCLWILGDWEKYSGPLGLAMRIIWGALWVLIIATVLTRVAIFGWQKKKLEQNERGPAEPDKS